MKVGRIIDGYLQAVEIEDSEQTKYAELGWKVVDAIDDAPRLQCEENYIIRVVPYDNGDRISYNYEKVFDIQKQKREIQQCKDALTNTDYQVIKCYEASLSGASMPYDVEELLKTRQELRDRINNIEENLTLSVLDTH